ncbi:hypothetical protein OESDEN_09725 [Oesophagostomum dentatum]|uniref:Serpin domain-containing protein n=1 Tax=Oesophagostomum dentatum TaxID=61180 RepID=A0A0B1SYP4_OESDE|nr:hypothetical protein OESDEN_09725 [Oesophagostomum dentatum]
MALHALKNCRYTVGNGAQVLAMPYKDKEYEFVVFLPLESVKFEEFRSNLTGDAMKELLSQATNETNGVNIRMPKFKVTSQPPMKQMLQQLGISHLFCDGCDLKGVCENEDLFVDDVIHKAVVEVSEEGTKAAAATAVLFCRGRRPMVAVAPTFRADHPFVYGIFLSGEPLFIGQYC